MLPTLRRSAGLALLLAAVPLLAPLGTSPALPNKPGTLKFAVIGDNGTGDRPQFELAAQMVSMRGRFPFDLVLMVGDNFYGRQRASDLVEKFERPYQPLLAAGVRFQAVLGNHDEPRTVDYPPINMEGRRYYTFARENVRFFALDTNSLEPQQVSWFESALAAAREEWKIVYFHHPLYSSGNRHGSAIDLRVLLEPLLVRYGVSLVFSGHDHIYERLVPQKGITYFVCGSGGKLRKGGLSRSDQTAAGHDQDQAFLLGEIEGEHFWFEVIARTGAVVDTGMVQRRTLTGS